MASVMKPKYEKHGKPGEGPRWYVRFRDHNGKRQRVVGFTDKRASEELGRWLELLVASKKNMQAPDAKLAKWLEAQDADLRARLSEFGILDERTKSITSPLTVHVNEWHRDKLAEGVTKMHADTYKARVLRVLAGCSFTLWRDIRAVAVKAWLADERDAKRFKDRTSNHVLTAIGDFCGWMVSEGRAATSPLANLKKGVTVKDEERFGVFTPEQVATLLAHVERATDAWGVNQRKRRPPKVTGPSPGRSLSGPRRALVYKFAVETAMRAEAIRSVTVGQFRFDREEVPSPIAGFKPSIRVVGGVVRTTVGQQKNKKPHDVPLRAAFAAEMADRLAGLAPDVRPFGDLPEYAAAMLRNDLFNAGLPTTDEDGLPLKFHSFRATCATWLGEAGASATDIAAVTGHLTRSMCDHYTHATKRAGRRAIEKLPELAVLAVAKAS